MTVDARDRQIAQLRRLIEALEIRLLKFEEKHAKLAKKLAQLDYFVEVWSDNTLLHEGDIFERLTTVEQTLFPGIAADLQKVDRAIGWKGQKAPWQLDRRRAVKKN
jgi:hypothetical protein